jgi:geranylgeranyl diphosphate synthase type I
MRRKTITAQAAALPQEVTDTLSALLHSGGKRLRPLLCVLGWHAARGAGSMAPAVQAGAALEMFHAFCLLHDDVMDRSDTRRGQLTAQRTLAARHAVGRISADAQHIGACAAILIGDLALTWSDELLRESYAGLEQQQLARLLSLVDAMRSEVMYGQYLDLIATGRPSTDLDHALLIIRYKTAKYTMERPLHIGAALAGGNDLLMKSLSAFALPLGEAFQLRDDLLGVFGTATETGKSCLDDLREGKHTCLIALALQHAAPEQADQLRLLLGCPTLTEGQAQIARRIITATGAPAMVERMITERFEHAKTALDEAPIPADIRSQLRDLAEQGVWRTG